MPGKAANFAWILRSNPMIQGWFKVLTLAFLVGILVVWGIDGWDVSNFHTNFVDVKLSSGRSSSSTHEIVEETDKFFSSDDVSVQFIDSTLHRQNIHEIGRSHENLTQAHESLGPKIAPLPQKLLYLSNGSPQPSDNLSHSDPPIQKPNPISFPKKVDWISAEFEGNYSTNLLAQWLAPGGEPCKDSKTVEISIPGLDGHDQIELSTGDVHEFVFQALDELGKPHCLGGDYFETDLSGESWKSRPPVKDLGNGTYTFSLQVHPDFPGVYNFTLILLFRHYEGLKFSTQRFAFDALLRNVTIKFSKSLTQLPEIKQCRGSDLTRDVWSGRWTRHAKNDNCGISDDGRYRCLKPNYPCQKPWCHGSLGIIESNGWIYSTHCSFNMFSREKAWQCLNGRWIFWWGDSNHCDTIRNILHFILDVPEPKVVSRWFDMNISNPRNPAQMVRITSIFNGHPNETGNYRGLDSLIDEGYRNKLKGYFSQEVVPDTVVMNSGLHDGIFWKNIRRFIGGAEYAAAFWAEVMKGVRQRGLVAPQIIYRTTVATGGYARRLSYNPQKMEAFNLVVLDKFRKFGLINTVIDDFDLTYPWHYDNRCNDGVHYGRAPSKIRWRDGEIGHQYFVDLMLCHVLLNALCAK